MGRTNNSIVNLKFFPEKFILSKLSAPMHSRKGQKVSSFLGDKLLISPVQGTLEILLQWNLVNTVTNRSKTFGRITWAGSNLMT